MKNRLQRETQKPSLNPFVRIENFFQKKKAKKKEKMLQMQLAILSGGIKRMK